MLNDDKFLHRVAKKKILFENFYTNVHYGVHNGSTENDV